MGLTQAQCLFVSHYNNTHAQAGMYYSLILFSFIIYIDIYTIYNQPHMVTVNSLL